MGKKVNADIRLGRLELQILNVVWEKGRATVHDVKEVLGKGRKPAYTTILAMMRKMDAKGYLEHDVEGRTFIYRAAISQKDVRYDVLNDILERLFEGSPALMVNSLVEQKGISEEDLEQIKKITLEAKKNR
ncbi:MAG: BlaI/MecI/CopY family transcriptional regulator [Deltaproteobacteria bacterium]|nr:BlaI/MecI/CopY family transcriptional regulator [Deltaproteobacteria bacterium]